MDELAVDFELGVVAKLDGALQDGLDVSQGRVVVNEVVADGGTTAVDEEETLSHPSCRSDVAVMVAKQ